MGLFSRKEKDPEVEAAKRKADADIAAVRKQERIDREQHRVERAKTETEAKAARREEHENAYDRARHAAAVAAGEAKAKEDAATVGMAPGTKFLRRAAGAVQKLSGPGAAPARTVRTTEVVGGKTITTETHYPGGRPGGRRVIPAFEVGGLGGGFGGFSRRPQPQPKPKTRTVLVETSPGVYTRQQVPQPGPAPAARAAAPRPVVPGLARGAGLDQFRVGTSPGLRVGASPGAKKKGKTGIPFLDQGW